MSGHLSLALNIIVLIFKNTDIYIFNIKKIYTFLCKKCLDICI